MSLNIQKIIENSYRNLNDDAIEKFLKIVEVYTDEWEKEVDSKYDSKVYENFSTNEIIDGSGGVFDYQYDLIREVKQLSNELAILGLFKKVEIHTKKLISWYLPSIDEKSLYRYDLLIKALPFELKNVKNHREFNELRLINNSIKHEGVVSQELSKEYPIWKVGADLVDLDCVYDRLSKCIAIYIDDLATQIARSSER